MKSRVRYILSSTIIALLFIIVIVLCAAAYGKRPKAVNTDQDQTAAMSEGYSNDSILYLDSSDSDITSAAVIEDNTTFATRNETTTQDTKKEETTKSLSIFDKLRKDEKSETTTAVKAIDRKNKKYVFNLRKQIFSGFAALAVSGVKYEFDEASYIAEKLKLPLSNQKGAEYSYESSDKKSSLYSKISKTDISLYITYSGPEKIVFQNGLTFGMDQQNVNRILGNSIYKIKDVDGNDICTYVTVKDEKTGDEMKYVAIFKNNQLIGIRIDLHDGEVK